MTRVAKDVLHIVDRGELTSGIAMFALGSTSGWIPPEFPRREWDLTTNPTRFRLHGPGWVVHEWDVPIARWPDRIDFQERVKRTLTYLIDAGSTVAWISGEGFPFCDPPSLFDPDCMSGGVLTWLTDRGEYGSPISPEQPLEPASDETLELLRGYYRDRERLDV